MCNNILILIASLCFFTNCNSQETDKESNIPIPEKTIIDSLVLIKSARMLTVFSQSKKVKTYYVALGKHPVGKKEFEGDRKTPEGLYYIDAKSAASKYHKNLNISYPNVEDIKHAATQSKRAGGDIKIHGLPNGYDEKNYERSDWTWGCIGLTNTEIAELFSHIQLGSPILMLP